ncbi:hypothetical protein Cadr_000021307 [Camelus dromedarius]|uniref:Uncharacterized protein n=1 Tax=Camelus dromedarius TaxID=9838 RepID=A0A5N4CTN0_CAMDR|nr:hypothetical protein Cadr_000021307 [Camelus dromedarius]
MDSLEGKAIFVQVRNEEAMFGFVQDERSGMSTLETYGKFYHGQKKLEPVKEKETESLEKWDKANMSGGNRSQFLIVLCSDDPVTQWPLHVLFPEGITVRFSTQDVVPFSPISGMDDAVTVQTTENPVTETTEHVTTPIRLPQRIFSEERETRDPHKHWE